MCTVHNHCFYLSACCLIAFSITSSQVVGYDNHLLHSGLKVGVMMTFLNKLMMNLYWYYVAYYLFITVNNVILNFITNNQTHKFKIL